MSRCRAFAAIALVALLTFNQPEMCAAASPVSLGATAVLAAEADRLDGKITLSLVSAEPIYDARVYARAQGDKTLIGRVEYWGPGERHSFDLGLASEHPHPGDYHLLIEAAFRDLAGANQALAQALGYRIARLDDSPPPHALKEVVPNVRLENRRVIWASPDPDLEQIRLTLTTEPSWISPGPLSPPASRILLQPSSERPAIPNWSYGQLARLEWVHEGQHHSRVLNWALRTDAEGQWQGLVQDFSSPPWWRQPAKLWTIAGLLAVGTFAGFRRKGNAVGHPWLTARRGEWVGVIALLALCAWTVSHANPALWLTQTWSTGGDVASQVFYAKVFMEWLPTGKISGWLPESFAGFPAFTFYFPLPFALAGLVQFAVGPQVAFKLVSMLPVFLLPLAVYAVGASWRWGVPMRLLAAAGTTGFILGDATSIWGGNVLAQLAGEFAYSWGFLFAVLFWGALGLALRKGGRWWILAAVLEALVALSHGYALLMAGFGAFAYLLLSGNLLRHLRIILQVHLLAFLLIGFWLIPLVENLPWTIPNDGATAIDNWRIVWPATLWPLAVGWIVLLALLLGRPSTGWPYGIAFLLGIGLLGYLGFVAGGRMGLADLRFFPYAQWALATASGAAIGWALQRWLPAVSLPIAIALSVAMTAWWEPRLATMEGWSRWNLAGYEQKPMWPHYLASAQVNAGPLEGPRLVFEHDPSNADLGSTRALEALPMFGSRPTLEGLYMESATTGPFIYQLQAELSERPSSPLSRYPSSARSLDDAVEHMNELYTNRVLLRSTEKKALLGADPRFRLVAEHGPLQTYELIDLRTQLVERLDIPVLAASRDDWLKHAFRRFLLHHPYQEREVYLAEGERLPQHQVEEDAGRVEIRTFSRERLVFETDHPGQPHLIRMTYHPRWKSRGGETLYLTEPSFMLIYPQSRTVELVYGWSWGQWLGTAFTLSGFILLAAALVRGSPLNPSRNANTFTFYQRRISGVLILASGVLLAALWTDPERVYQQGHYVLNQGHQAAAARLFDQAFYGRRAPAARAEALFWAGRSYQLAGELDEARVKYELLRNDFPESYWYPETVYRLIEIHVQFGDLVAAERYYPDLVRTVPDNPWTREAAQILERDLP